MWLSETKLLQSVPSPDGTYVADVYERGGGSALGNVAELVSIRPATEAFRAKPDYVFGLHDADVADVRWISTRHLQVTFTFSNPPPAVMVTRAETSWRDVTITYVRRVPEAEY
jgi:hypothetical protein